MTKRALLVAVILCLTAAACGTRVTEEVSSSSATSLVQRSTGTGTTGTDGSAATAGTDGSATTVAGAGTTTGGDTASGTTGTAASTTGSATAATTGGSTRPASGAPIVLGAVGTKSGIVGAALEGGFRGVTVWEKWVNANGGIQGRPVKVIQVDDGGDPAKAAAAVRTLIREQGVVAFVGNIAPFTFSAQVPYLEQAGVASLGGDGADAAWFSSPDAFPINGQTISRSRPGAKWALAHLPQRKLAAFYVSEAAAPTVLANNFVDEWRKGGGQVAVQAGVSIATPDFTSEVVQAQNSGADIVFLLLEKAACNRFFDAADRQGYHPIIVAPACTIDNALGHKALATNHLYSVASARNAFTPDSPAQAEAYKAGQRFDPSLSLDGAFMFGWLAGKLFQEAMAQPGAVLTPKGIIDALHRLPATSLGGLTPTQAWPPGPHAEGRCGLISKFDGTRFVLQTPDFIC